MTKINQSHIGMYCIVDGERERIVGLTEDRKHVFLFPDRKVRSSKVSIETTDNVHYNVFSNP